MNAGVTYGEGVAVPKKVATSEIIEHVRVPINHFVAEYVDNHPAAAPFLQVGKRDQTGRLEEIDRREKESALQMKMLANNCSQILTESRDTDVRAQACDSVIETAIRLQNPAYATDQVEVQNEAYRMHAEFFNSQAMRHHQGVDVEVLNREVDPSIDMLQQFDEYLTDRYDMAAMRERAVLTLMPMVDHSVMREFVDISGIVPELDRSFGTVARKLGNFVAGRMVLLKVA